MIAPEPPTGTQWIDIAKILAFALPPFALIWRAIDKYFKDKAEERETFIKHVVKEVMETAMEPMKEQLRQMATHHEDSIKYIHERINDLIKGK